MSRSRSIITGSTYDFNENPFENTQPEGNMVRQLYDERDLLYMTYRGAETSQWTSVQRDYDANGNLKKVIDGNQHETTYLYDGFDRMTGYIDALGNKVEQELDDVGNVIRVTRKRGPENTVILNETRYFFDEMNRNYETIEKLFDQPGDPVTDVVTKNEFDKNSRLVLTRDANLHDTQTFYDGLDRVHRTLDHLGNEIEYTYDANSNVIEVKETEQPGGSTYTTVNVYDDLDRLETTTDPGSVTRERQYDSRNNLVKTIDGEQNTISHYYDGLNRSYKTIRGGGVITQNVWDDNSRLVNLIDANSNITIRQYDALNRLKTETYPDTSTKQYDYDGADNIRQIIDQNGSEINQDFDDLNRLTIKNINPAPGVLGVTSEQFGYDELSRMTSATNDYSTVTMQYDSLSRLREETQKIGPQSVKSVVSGYDSVGNRTSLIYPSGKTISYQPDALNRIESITEGGQLIAQYTYEGPFRTKERLAGNGTRVVYSHDANRRIIKDEHFTANNVSHSLEYYFDNENNILRRKREPTGYGDVFRYDSLYRITGSRYTISNSLIDPATEYEDYNTYLNKQDLTVDAVGNWETAEYDHYLSGLETKIYTINNLNQYTRIENKSIQIITHDLNGNLTNDGYKIYKYDYANRLMAVNKSDNTPIVIYLYDALGRRILQNKLGFQITSFYYDGLNVITDYAISSPESLE
ncbi:MAG: RHS repeat protein, partial [Planctomycetes bacterium]|nr:RHS repeat protein [Planctomycetota bacterium]